MRIVIDARMMGPRWTGIGLYSRKLIENLQKIDQSNNYFVLVDQDQFDAWTPPAKNFHKILAPYKVYGLSEQLWLPNKIASLKPDLVHFLHINAPLLYRGRRIVTVHDTTMLDFDLSPGGFVGSLKYAIKQLGLRLSMRSLTRAQAIITPSQATANSLVRHFGTGLQNKTFVTHEAVDYNEPLTPKTISVDPPKLLYVGNLYPYKNVGTLISAMADVVKVHSEARLQIVGHTPRFVNHLKDQSKQLGLGKSVEFGGFLDRPELDKSYQAASIFVFPSLSEGFGLPPLEAMAVGVPVVAAKASCLPEVLKDAARFFEPKDASDLASVINDLIAKPGQLADMQKRGYDLIKSYSWKRMATQTLAIYKS